MRDEERGLVSVHLAAELDLVKVSEHLAGRGVYLRRLERHDPTLEQVFMKLTAEVGGGEKPGHG